MMLIISQKSRRQSCALHTWSRCCDTGRFPTDHLAFHPSASCRTMAAGTPRCNPRRRTNSTKSLTRWAKDFVRNYQHGWWPGPRPGSLGRTTSTHYPRIPQLGNLLGINLPKRSSCNHFQGKWRFQSKFSDRETSPWRCSCASLGTARSSQSQSNHILAQMPPMW